MKKWLIFSLVLIVAGAIMFCVQVGGADWDFAKLDTEKVTEMNFTTQENQEIQAEGVTKVSVKIHSTKFKLTRSGTEFSLRYYESEIYTYDIGLEEGTLRFHEKQNGWKQFLRMFTGFKRSKLTTELVIPENFAGELDITCANGDLSLDGGAFDSLSMRTTNGGVSLSNLTAKRVTAKSTNGTITLQNVRGEEVSMDTRSLRARRDRGHTFGQNDQRRDHALAERDQGLHAQDDQRRNPCRGEPGGQTARGYDKR